MHSLCESCSLMREVVTRKGSRFLLCRLSQTNSAYPKYPAQPVVRCDGFRELGQSASPSTGQQVIAAQTKLVEMNFLIRPETPADVEAIRHINRLAFGQNGEGQLVDALREGGHVRASLVAERDGQVVGHILFSTLTIITESGTVPALALAPMAVLPTLQNQGIGSELIREGLVRCREQGHRIVIVLGHPNFYPRFGFSAKLAESLSSPFGGSEAWMALELVPGALCGIVGRVEYAPPFRAFDK